MSGPITPTGALRASWAVFIVVLSLVLAMVFTVTYTVRSQRLSDQSWCDLLRALDTPLPASPSPSRRQADIAAKIHALRVAKGCKEATP